MYDEYLDYVASVKWDRSSNLDILQSEDIISPLSNKTIRNALVNKVSITYEEEGAKVELLIMPLQINRIYKLTYSNVTSFNYPRKCFAVFNRIKFNELIVNKKHKYIHTFLFESGWILKIKSQEMFFELEQI